MSVALADQGYSDAQLVITKTLDEDEMFSTFNFIPFVLTQLCDVLDVSSLSLYSHKVEKLEEYGIIIDLNEQTDESHEMQGLIAKYEEIEVNKLDAGYRITGIVPYGNIGIKLGNNTSISYKHFTSDLRHTYHLPESKNVLYDIEGNTELVGLYFEFGNPYLSENSSLRIVSQTDLIYKNKPMSTHIRNIIEYLQERGWILEQNPML